MTLVVIAAILASAALSVVLTVMARRISMRLGFVDRPGGHKAHAAPVALGGGVAIFLTPAILLLIGTAAARWLVDAEPPGWLPEVLVPHLSGIASKLPIVAAILGGAALLHVLGLIDDIRPLGALPKLVAQTAVSAILVIVFEIRAVEALGSGASIVLTVFWLVLIINAFNFLDNMDGLSAGVAAIAAAVFATTAMIAGQLFVPVMAWVLVGTLLGFLAFNFPPASIFMGDAGSMVIGYFLGILTVMTTYYDPAQSLHPVGVLAPLVVLAVPLYDVASVCIIRRRAGQSLFRGDRRHFSHRLVAKGMSTRAAVATIYLATLATSLSAVALPRADRLTAGLIFLQCFCVVLIIALLEHHRAGNCVGGE